MATSTDEEHGSDYHQFDQQDATKKGWKRGSILAIALAVAVGCAVAVATVSGTGSSPDTVAATDSSLKMAAGQCSTDPCYCKQQGQKYHASGDVTFNPDCLRGGLGCGAHKADCCQFCGGDGSYASNKCEPFPEMSKDICPDVVSAGPVTTVPPSDDDTSMCKSHWEECAAEATLKENTYFTGTCVHGGMGCNVKGLDCCKFCGFGPFPECPPGFFIGPTTSTSTSTTKTTTTETTTTKTTATATDTTTTETTTTDTTTTDTDTTTTETTTTDTDTTTTETTTTETTTTEPTTTVTDTTTTQTTTTETTTTDTDTTTTETTTTKTTTTDTKTTTTGTSTTRPPTTTKTTTTGTSTTETSTTSTRLRGVQTISISIVNNYNAVLKWVDTSPTRGFRCQPNRNSVETGDTMVVFCPRSSESSAGTFRLQLDRCNMEPITFTYDARGSESGLKGHVAPEWIMNDARHPGVILTMTTDNLHYQQASCIYKLTTDCHNFGDDRGRCGPLFEHTVCSGTPDWSVYCNEDNGWCGVTDAHRDLQKSTKYDKPDYVNPACLPCKN